MPWRDALYTAPTRFANALAAATTYGYAQSYAERDGGGDRFALSHSGLRPRTTHVDGLAYAERARFSEHCARVPGSVPLNH